MGNYRDDPDAVSLRTTPDDAYVDDHERASSSDMPDILTPPPSYSDSNDDGFFDGDENNNTGDTGDGEGNGEEEGLLDSVTAPPPEHAYGGMSFITGQTNPQKHIETTSRRIGAKRTSINKEILSVQEPRSDTDATYLKLWINIMSNYAPSPYIHVTGTHQETRTDRDGKRKREEVTDFRILISMKNYLWHNFKSGSPKLRKLITVENGEKTYRGGIFKTRAPGAKQDIEVGGDAKPTLEEWCHRYCASSSGTRVFRLSRSVTGMDEEFIRSRLAGLIRATNYKGNLSIEFPVADRAVDIYSKGFINNNRLKTWVCWVFYLTFLWIFSWPLLLLTTKRYHVVRVEWPFSQTDAQGNKKYTTVSEEQWIDKFGPAVRQLCLDRYQGLAGDAVLSQVLERPETHQPNQPVEFRVGQAAVGAAVNAFRGGPMNALGQVNNLMRFAGGSNDPIGWGFDT